MGSLPPGGSSWITCVQEFPEPVVAGRHEIRGDAGTICKLHRRRTRGVRQLVDLQMLFHRGHTGRRRTVDDEGAEEQPVAVRARPDHDVARRDVTFVSGRQHEVFAAAPPVLAGQPDIRDPAVPEVIDAAEHLGRHLDDNRALLRVQPDEVVDRIVVRRQLHRPCVDQVLPDDVGLVVRSELADRIPHSRLVHDRYRHQVGLQRARPIKVVVDLLDGGGFGIAVVQVQRTDRTLEPVRHGDAGCDRSRVLVRRRGVRAGRWFRTRGAVPMASSSALANAPTILDLFISLSRVLRQGCNRQRD